MTSHLTFVSCLLHWEECSQQNSCDKTAHLPEESSHLNTLPQEWLQELIGNCEINKYYIALYDTSGEEHNDDGPAIEWFDGEKGWYQHGKKHRIDGPAIIEADGTQEWWIDGKLHREKGPAIIWEDGEKGWWLNGVRQLDPEDEALTS